MNLGLLHTKRAAGFAQAEVDWLLQIGGIEIEQEKILGIDINLAALNAKFNAVFLAMGLNGSE